MKRDFLKDLLGKVENADDIIDKIMSENGADINKAKGDTSAKDSKITELTEQITKLTTDASKFKDYDAIVKENQSFKAEKENTKKVEWLTKQGCKHPELIMSNLDFSKATYDEAKKAYTGLEEDLKTCKSKYGDMFTAQKTIVDDPSGGKQNELTGVDEAFARLNPSLKIN